MRFLVALAFGLLLPLTAAAQLLQLDRTDAGRTRVGELEFRGAVLIPPGPGRLGGLSALVAEPDGSLLALSDIGRVFRLQPSWNTDGQLTGVTVAAGTALRDEDGSLPQTRRRWDAEAMLRNRDGWLVAYERDHRIEQYVDELGMPGGRPVPYPVPAGLARLPRNGGLESLALLGDGSLLALAEAGIGAGSPLHSGWLWQEGHWRELSYEATPAFSPSDMTVLPDGRVVVLERGFNLLYGFRARLVLVEPEQIRSGALLQGKLLAALENPVLNENFEGLAASVGPEGGSRLFVVSDNNFNAAQQTILAVFDLSPH